MTKGTFPKTVESAEFDFIKMKGLEEENEKLKNEKCELLDILERCYICSGERGYLSKICLDDVLNLINKHK